MTTSKIILNGSNGTYRAVIYNNAGIQVAVVTGTCPQDAPEQYKDSLKHYYNYIFNVDQPPFDKVDWKVSVPIEGMGGWSILCNSKSRAFKIANNEISKRGKVINRLFHMPVSFLLNTLV